MLKTLFFSLLLLIKVAIADSFIPQLQPFLVKVIPNDSQFILVQFTIQPNFYLYQNKIKIVSLADSQVKLGKVEFPTAKILKSKDLGELKVYSGKLALKVPIVNFANGILKIKIDYQGCKGLGMCYPSQEFVQTIDLKAKKILTNSLSESKGLANAQTNYTQLENSITDQMQVTSELALTDIIDNSGDSKFIRHIFAAKSWFMIIGVFFLIGLFIAFTPCVFPMLPVLILVISGKQLNLRRSFTLALSYVIGGAVVYAIFGVIAARLGDVVNNYLQSQWTTLIISGLFLVFAFAMLDLFNVQLPVTTQNRLTRLINKYNHGSIFNAFIIGGIANLILSPCVTAPLAGALIYITTTGNELLGALALFALGIGSGVPLIAIALFGKRILPKSGLWMVFFKRLLAIIMLAMPLYLLSKIISSGLLKWLILAWLIISAVILVFTLMRGSKWTKIFTATAIGIVLSWLYLNQLNLFTKHDVAKPNWTIVTTVESLEQSLNKIKLNHQPVVIYYYASWCSACKMMELLTFSDKRVRQLLADNFAVIKVDASETSPRTKLLLKQYAIQGLPTIIFLDKKQKLIQEEEKVGFVGAKKLSDHLQVLLNR